MYKSDAVSEKIWTLSFAGTLIDRPHSEVAEIKNQDRYDNESRCGLEKWGQNVCAPD